MEKEKAGRREGSSRRARSGSGWREDEWGSVGQTRQDTDSRTAYLSPSGLGLGFPGGALTLHMGPWPLTGLFRRRM